MVSFFSSLYYKISSMVFETTTMVRLMSSTVSIVSILGFLALDFFHEEVFIGETFIFLDVSVSSGGFCGDVTSP